MKKAHFPVTPTKNAPIEGIIRINPQKDCNLKNCEGNVNFGIFFDGTNNNMERDAANQADSNIARLYDVYRDLKQDGYRRLYVPGVGTKFPEIGEYFETAAGSGCAFGCEARVIYGLLTVFNALHSRCYGQDLFNKRTVLALCRNSTGVADDTDCEQLAKLGIPYGLLQPDAGNDENRREFLRGQANYLKAKLETGKPRVVECFVDVFGFSRGAAQARVFCSWLDELLVHGCLAGVPLHIRFVGIFDTVASAGFWSGTAALIKNSTGGHGAWASAESLSIPSSVKNCVHMVAMHELRRNFPLDEIGSGGKLQPGWIQHAYPGAHSDVGGGYEPGEFGVSTGDDSLKLSQIPLNHMLECAIAAGAPIKKHLISSGRHDPFAIHRDLSKAYSDFISQATLAPRPIYEWMQIYLNWRWQIRDQFDTIGQVKRAKLTQRELLINFNKKLIDEATALTQPKLKTAGRRTFSTLTDMFTNAKRNLVSSYIFEPEAPEALALARRAGATPPAYAALFDGYVHDSLAGFNKPNLELTGYWRYRRVFLGNDDPVIAANQANDTARRFA